MGGRAPTETLAGPGGDGGPRRHSPWILPTVLLVLVLAGGGTAAALVLTGHHGANHPQASGTTKPPASPTSAPSATATQTPATASPSPTQIPGLLPMAPGVAQNAQSQQIAAMLDRYFSAINHRNYFEYYAMLSPQQQQQTSQSQFNNGFATTRDSRETLQGVSPGPGGTTVATVTFTSHQNPADSVNGRESCTRWQISLYLEHVGNSLVISKPPSSYRASYRAC